MKARIAIAAALVLVACASQQKRADSLTRGVRSYHEGLRWRSFADAAVYLPLPERAAFLDAHEELREDLRIDEYRIRRIIYGPKTETAEVRVEYTWHLDSRGLVKKTVATQSWELRGERWLLTDEVRVRGEPMPTVPEPAEPGETGESGETGEPGEAGNPGVP